MKKTSRYSDLDEFWVVGDLVAKAFMGWGGECCQCYIDFGDPSKAERFSTYKEALKYMKHDEDAAEWVKDHGGSRFAKPLRCRKSVVVYPPGVRP
jgi:hypothetical protein